MATYRIEVTNGVASWGYRGRIYRPGVHEVDEETANAARSHPAVIVHEGPGPTGEYPSPAPDPGPVTTDDLRQGNLQELMCEECGAGPFKSNAGLSAHRRLVHESGGEEE